MVDLRLSSDMIADEGAGGKTRDGGRRQGANGVTRRVCDIHQHARDLSLTVQVQVGLEVRVGAQLLLVKERCQLLQSTQSLWYLILGTHIRREMRKGFYCSNSLGEVTHPPRR